MYEQRQDKKDATATDSIQAVHGSRNLCGTDSSR
jgi:hypothetical protein